MNYKNKNLEELGKKIDNLDNQNKKPYIKKKESGAVRKQNTFSHHTVSKK